MRVTAHLLETLNITDPDIIAAAPLHDIFEDHPIDLVYALTGERELDPQKARKIGHEVLARLTNIDVVEIIESVTNPIVMIKSISIIKSRQYVDLMLWQGLVNDCRTTHDLIYNSS